MFPNQSTVAAARRDSIIAFYGPFAAALVLLTSIVFPGAEVPSHVSSVTATEPEMNFGVGISTGTTQDREIMPPSVKTVIFTAKAMEGDEISGSAAAQVDDGAVIRTEFTLPPTQVIGRQFPIHTAAESDPDSPMQGLTRQKPGNLTLVQEYLTESKSKSEAEAKIEPDFQPVGPVPALTERFIGEIRSSGQSDEFTPVSSDPNDSGTGRQQDTAVDTSARMGSGNSGRMVSWGQLARSLVEYDGPQLTLDSHRSDNKLDSGAGARLERPEIFVRPYLPPNRLISPVQRPELIRPPIRALVP